MLKLANLTLLPDAVFVKISSLKVTSDHRHFVAGSPCNEFCQGDVAIDVLITGFEYRS